MNKNNLILLTALIIISLCGESVLLANMSSGEMNMMRDNVFPENSGRSEPAVTIIARPAYVDISEETSRSAIKVKGENFPEATVRYRIINGDNQYNCWDYESQVFVSSTNYADGPQVPGDMIEEAVWWIFYERGSNISTEAVLSFRVGPDYDEELLSIELPDASAIVDYFTLNLDYSNSDPPLRNNADVTLGQAVNENEFLSSVNFKLEIDLEQDTLPIRIDNSEIITQIISSGITGNTVHQVTTVIGEWPGDTTIIVPSGDEEDDDQPVELSSFTASVTANSFVELQWISQTETNMLGYNVFRSSSEVLNEAVIMNTSIINAHNSSQQQVYIYEDVHVDIGETYYYWLQSVDLDLTNEFHGPVSITVQEEEMIEPPVYRTKLYNNYPNPFNPVTTINYSLSEDVDMMELKIYNIQGQLVQTLREGHHKKGEYCVNWDGLDYLGKPVSSGIYFYRMSTPFYDKAYKMMILK